MVEALEPRQLLALFYTAIGSSSLLRSIGSVQRHNETTGAWIDEIVPPGAGGLRTPNGVLIGPDGKVRKHWAKVAKAADHPAAVLEALEAGA